MQTETQILARIFNKGILADHTLYWVCAPMVPEGFYDHQEHEDTVCTYDYSTAKDRLPYSQVSFADSLAEYIGTGELIYVAALEEWRVMNDGSYRALAGDWFIHNCIRQYAERLRLIVEGHTLELYSHDGDFVEVQELEGIDGMAQRRIKGTMSIIRDDNENQRKAIKEESEKLWAEYKDDFREVRKLLTGLGSLSGITAVTTLMKSRLHEAPASNKGSKFLTNTELLAQPILKPLVDGLIPATGLGQIYGASYIGKTFASLDLALSVAAGLDSWMGKPMNLEGRWVEDGEGGTMDMRQQVLYIAAEGGQPYANAIRGWELAHPCANTDMFLSYDGATSDQLVLSDKPLPPDVHSLDDLRRDLETAAIKPRLVIVDTQAAVTPGIDENSKALGDALQPLKTWADSEGILVLLVHHTGKTPGQGARGSSVQMAMMDVQIEFLKTDKGRSMKFVKVKGAPEPDNPVDVEILDVHSPSGEQYGYLSYVGNSTTKVQAKGLAVLETRGKVTTALGSGLTSARSIAIQYFGGASKRSIVQAELDRMEADGLIQNTGTGNNSNWVLVPLRSSSF